MKKLKNNELKRINIEEFKKSHKIPLTIILDNVRSAFNVGAIFRTADAFLIQKIILCGITAIPPNKEIHKAALGATLSVEWEYYNNTSEIIHKLKKEKTHIIAVEQTKESKPLHNFIHKKESIAIIVGNEVNGISEEVLNLCDDFIEIEQFGTKHSLNISVATAIVTWEFWKKLT
tara:strand:+ start:167 stop:691 length:525 start_codon:yes stop_codon:yes gene_type:complete